MKRVFLLLSLSILLSTILVNSGTFSTDGIYDNSHLYMSFNDDRDEIQIFPNPVTDKILNITSENSIAKIEILDIIGSTVFIQEYDTDTRKVVLSLDNLNRGMYIIKVKLENKTAFTEKIMIK